MSTTQNYRELNRRKYYVYCYECTADNLRTLIDNIPNELEEDDKATCEWCMLNVGDVNIEITDNRTQIYYSDDSFNIMEIIEVTWKCKTDLWHTGQPID